ncbi:MAG: hypothetical protein CM1200mP41_33040 [Gammaproteobacteria bacterium]|nr:MAG: hypothetical protein CM1200mP41_33040 [Gammaproteobacteria bacterium]
MPGTRDGRPDDHYQLMEAGCFSAPALLHSLNNAIQPAQMWPAIEFLTAKRAKQSNRYYRYGDTAYNLEPHLKEGPGGLRDLHMIGWISKEPLGH